MTTEQIQNANKIMEDSPPPKKKQRLQYSGVWGNPVTCLPTAREGLSLDATHILAGSGLGLLSPSQLWQG